MNTFKRYALAALIFALITGAITWGILGFVSCTLFADGTYSWGSYSTLYRMAVVSGGFLFSLTILALVGGIVYGIAEALRSPTADAPNSGDCSPRVGKDRGEAAKGHQGESGEEREAIE